MTEENPGDTNSKITEEKAEDIDNQITRDDTGGKNTSFSYNFGVPAPTVNDDCSKDMNYPSPTPKMTLESPDNTEYRTAEDTASGTDNQITQDRTDDTDASSSACLEQGGSDKKRKLSDSDNPGKKKDTKVMEEAIGIKLNEEKYFMNLISYAGDFLKTSLNISDDSVLEAKENVITNFHYSEGKRFKDNDFTNPANVIGYFTRNGPTSAGVARFKISKIMHENENIRNELQNFTSPIKLLDLGTGHGCGIMGLCSSLNKFLREKCIHLTLVDHVKEWVPVFNIVEFLLRFKNFGEASDFFRNNYISTKYLVLKLGKQENLDEFYERSLNEADIIMISRVFSIADINYEDVARMVVYGMKIGALLFFIDAMGGLSDPFSYPELKKIASEEQENYVFEYTCKGPFEVSTTSKAKCFVYRKNYKSEDLG